MKRLITLAALLVLATPARAQFPTDSASTWNLAIATVGAFQCSAEEGLMTVEDSVKATYEFLKTRRDLETYQVQNIINSEGFWPAVTAFQKRHGGCRSIADGIKRRSERDAKPSPIY